MITNVTHAKKFWAKIAVVVILASVFVVALVFYVPSVIQSEQPINIVVTSFQVNFVYLGAASNYFTLLANVYRCSSPNSTAGYNCDTYSGPLGQASEHSFLDGIILQTVNNTAHTISNISVITQGFKSQMGGSMAFGGSSNTNAFPITGFTGGDFTVAVSYVGKTNYTGSVTVDIYSTG